MKNNDLMDEDYGKEMDSGCGKRHTVRIAFGAVVLIALTILVDRWILL